MIEILNEKRIISYIILIYLLKNSWGFYSTLSFGGSGAYL